MAEFKGFMLPQVVLEERIAERFLWLATTNEHKITTVNDLAQKMMRSGKFKSDPWAIPRMKAHLKSGIGTPDDYHKMVRTDKEPRF